MFTEHAHYRALSRSSVNVPPAHEIWNLHLIKRFIAAARWVDPALGFAVSVWIYDLASEFFLMLGHFRLDGYDSLT